MLIITFYTYTTHKHVKRNSRNCDLFKGALKVLGQLDSTIHGLNTQLHKTAFHTLIALHTI